MNMGRARSMLAALAMSGLFMCATFAQVPEMRVSAGWGTNLLFSPGTELQSSPGRTGSMALSMGVGTGWGKVHLQPALHYTGSAYRTRMAYQAFFVTRRSSLQLDLTVAARQMNGATLVVGPFVGFVQGASALFEQGSRANVVQGITTARILNEHFPNDREAGVVLQYSIPLDEKKRFGLDLSIRQHLLPLVEREQSYALQFSPDQRVLATNTRPTIVMVAVHYRFL